MFDQATEDLIRSAPALEGLDLNALPKEFTRIFAHIVSSRMRLRGFLSGENAGAADGDEAGGNTAGAIRQDVQKEIAFLSELASTQEAFISVSADRADRRAAAFVAGTAHYVLLQARRLVSDAELSSSLEIDAISPEVSATLLFLIAGASADAAEMCREIAGGSNSGSVVRERLLADVRRFAMGRLAELTEPVAFVRGPSDDTPSELACSGLYHLIHRALFRFARVMLGELDQAGIYDEFARIEALAVSSMPAGQTFSAYSVFSGPRHLAALLKSLCQDFPEASVANIPPPSGADPARWKHGVKEISQRRPYLWPNHIDAIRNGYLDVGTSSVISFPTGAGKSTLSELKILSTLSSKMNTIFLAPTLALVDQTARALDMAFPDAEVEREYASDDPFGFGENALPSITVMTPERCLSLMGFEPELFQGVGLVVFDECHLLHAADPERGKRAVDAMLCVLNAAQLAPKADMLMLSAMMSNPGDIAGWLQSVIDRPCLSFAMDWKPTRQVRGCLVYAVSEIDALKNVATEARLSGKTKAPPKALQKKMLAHAQGFFGLRQTWDTLQRQDYALMPLLDRPVQLALNEYWRPTPNANHVASAIAAAAIGSPSERSLKTLIFCQTTVNANSAAESARGRIGKYSIELSSAERVLYSLAVEEIGDPAALFVELSDSQKVTSSALPHHARLLPAERHLHESLYRRSDGIHVLAATSTLAQGMNLPSQIVLIAGDSRFDEGANQLERLEAHELLNAAGRAGRAGESSYGFVLVIPSKVVHFNDADGLIHAHWTQLRAIFSQGDQCLAIEDPLEPILDQIHLKGHQGSEKGEYLLRRLPVSVDDADADASAKLLLSRTLVAYKRRKAGDDAWVSSRVTSALKARQTLAGPREALDWADRLGAKFGVEPSTLRSLRKHLDVSPDDDTVVGWIDWLFAWLRNNAELFPRLVRDEGLEILFGAAYRKLLEDEDRGKFALKHLEPLLKRWIAGDTLHAIELVYGTASGKTKRCDNARDFVIRLVPDLAYVASLPELVRRECGDTHLDSLNFQRLSGCIREGLDSVEKLALFALRRRAGARIACHKDWARIEPRTQLPIAGESWSDLYRRVKRGKELSDA